MKPSVNPLLTHGALKHLGSIDSDLRTVLEQIKKHLFVYRKKQLRQVK